MKTMLTNIMKMTMQTTAEIIGYANAHAMSVLHAAHIIENAIVRELVIEHD